MLKHLNDWEMGDCKIFVKHFSGAATNCIENYRKPSLLKDPNHVILHVRTNGLILDKTWQDIVATSIGNLACSMKGKNCDVSISNIILRNDNKKFDQKAKR